MRLHLAFLENNSDAQIIQFEKNVRELTGHYLITKQSFISRDDFSCFVDKY